MTPTSRAIKSSYDVAIVGAGPSGICAAAVAAKGADVLLIDATNRFGGSVTAAMHRCMCGLYADEPQSALDTLNGSIQRSIVEKMYRMAPAAVRPRQFGKTWVLEFPALAWESALADTCAEAKIVPNMGCRITAVRRDRSHLTAIQIENPQPRWIEIKAVIDCTGGGHVLRLAGDDTFQRPDEQRMLGGYSVRLASLGGDAEMLRLQVPYALAQAVDCGTLPRTARFTAFYSGPGLGEGVCKLAINTQETSAGEAEQLAERVVQHLRKEIAAFADVRIVEKSPGILPRDGLRLRGKYTIIEQDILQARTHAPGAVHGWWPVEYWDPTRGPMYAYPPLGRHYDIPMDALVCAAVDNLFAAGCCISATAAAAASTRVSGICLATGEAAGWAAISFVNP